MISSDPITWLEMVMNGAGIKRFHTVHTLGNESIAEHSYGVAIMCLILTEGKAEARLLRFALFHDLAEQKIGDVPFPTKRQHPELKELLSKIEKKFEDKYQLTTNLLAEERLIFHWADMLQLMAYCRAQRALGNRNMDVVFNNGLVHLTSLEHHPIGQRILDHLVATYGEIT